MVCEFKKILSDFEVEENVFVFSIFKNTNNMNIYFFNRPKLSSGVAGVSSNVSCYTICNNHFFIFVSKFAFM